MINRFLITLLIITNSLNGIYGQDLKKDYQKLVSNFIDCIKMDKKEKIASMISYPFDREYPIPSIKNKQEFLSRFNDIFDDNFKKIIIKSNPSKDWSEMGWRGIMLNNGDLWLDFKGRLIGVNYQSEFEKKLKVNLIADDKKNLHPSLSQFSRPLYILETSKFRIRIDDLGNNKYRYASWPINKPMTDKPDIVLQNGQFIADGSGGNCSYQFKNGDYLYECSIIVMGEDDSPPAFLTISKGDKDILNQKALIIRK